jgi:hypothetical protein
VVKRILSFLGLFALVIAAMLVGPVVRIFSDSSVQASDWRTASRAPVGWAPSPEAYEPAVVQAYSAPTVGWRGAVADHSWIAYKPAGAEFYTRYEVLGWNVRRNRPAISETQTKTPDQKWYGSAPKLLRDIRGPEAEAIIAAFPAAVASYPYPNFYRVWPGPNSNTFVAHIAREIPALRLAMPGNTLGKDFTGWSVVTSAPSGTGYQLSLGGLFGLMLAGDEGFEVNVLGLVIGANPLHPTLTLPGVGRLPRRANWTDTDEKVASNTVGAGFEP